MPKTTKITLAGREYTIRELTSRRNAGWRKKLAEPFGALVTRIEAAGETDITSPRELVSLIRETAGTLLESPDLLAELLFDYAPELAADRERILEEAFDSELMTAFVEVLKLAFPFGSLVEKLSGLRSLGQPVQQTTPS